VNRKQRDGALRRLHRQMDSCRMCLEAGHEIFPRAIYSGGGRAKVMIIGQAPGITEKEAGRPFNAGSGTRLFQWLAAAGFDEDDFRTRQYMTAVTKCYPGRSKGGGDRVPSKQEQALCRPYLDAEIELVDPQLILPVGRLAISLFFGDKPLTEVIGREAEVAGHWIVPLPHPSGASRWHQLPENRKRIDHAIHKIRARRLALGL
jgi:uracil-DNA glycosylase family 4